MSQSGSFKGISSNSPFTVPFFCPDTSIPSADSHASAFGSNNILHLHTSLYHICELLPPVPGPRLWPSTTASRACLLSNHFPHRDQKDSRTHLWPLLSPPINPLASLVPRGKPASLPTWMPHPRCWLAAIPPSSPSFRSQGSWVASGARSGSFRAQVLLKPLPQRGVP